MGLTGNKTFVGIGLGAIQSGLFLYEAFQSGSFRRLVVVEVVPEVVAAVRKDGGYCSVNIAFSDHVESVHLGPLDIYNPAEEGDRQSILNAIAEADEIATAVPSVAFYVSENPGSIHRLLAGGLLHKVDLNGPRAVIYTAENNNHAAEILEKAVMDLIPGNNQASIRARVRFVNTVIGKMSQVVADPAEVQALGLTPITSDFPRAFLVEAFNQILISKIQFPDAFQRGIGVFQEKDNLLPFEEAKLYGHNATHALLGYLGGMAGFRCMADLKDVPGMISFARAAFIKESGAALIQKYPGVDGLFTQAGYMAYAEDLFERMTNPFLVDMINRVTRDTERKLGWNDRLIGTMRVAIKYNVVPRCYAIGAAAALVHFEPALMQNKQLVSGILDELWQKSSQNLEERNRLVVLIESALGKLRLWHSAGFPNPENFFLKGNFDIE